MLDPFDPAPATPDSATLTIVGEHQAWRLDLAPEVARAMRARPSMRRRIDAIIEVAVAEVAQVVEDLLTGEDSIADEGP